MTTTSPIDIVTSPPAISFDREKVCKAETKIVKETETIKSIETITKTLKDIVIKTNTKFETVTASVTKTSTKTIPGPTATITLKPSTVTEHNTKTKTVSVEFEKVVKETETFTKTIEKPLTVLIPGPTQTVKNTEFSTLTVYEPKETETKTVNVLSTVFVTSTLKPKKSKPVTVVESTTLTLTSTLPVVTKTEVATKFETLPVVTEVQTKIETVLNIIPTTVKVTLDPKTVTKTIEPETIFSTVVNTFTETSLFTVNVLQREIETKTISVTNVLEKTFYQTETSTTSVTVSVINNCEEKTVDSSTMSKNNNEIDCGDKICRKHIELRETCIIFLPTPVKNCNIPCDFSGCKTKLQHGLYCDIWHCAEKTTTSTTTTTTTTTTSTTTATTTATTTSETTTTTMLPTTTTNWIPIQPNSTSIPFYCSSVFTVGSLIMNLMVILALIIFCLRIYKRIKQRQRNQESVRQRPIIRRQRYSSSDDSQNPKPRKIPVKRFEKESNDGWLSFPFKMWAPKKEVQPQIIPMKAFSEEQEFSSSETDHIEITPMLSRKEFDEKTEKFRKSYGAVKVNDDKKMSKSFEDDLKEAEKIQQEYKKKCQQQVTVTLEQELLQAEKLAKIENEMKSLIEKEKEDEELKTEMEAELERLHNLGAVGGVGIEYD